MRLESDRMTNLLVDDEAFKSEREVVQQERRMRTENNPDGLMYQELMKLAFNKHSYGWPVIGYEEDLNRMTTADAQAFYKNFYHPSNAIVVIVGDINSDQAFELVKKYYGGIAKREMNQVVPEKEPEQIEPRRSTMKLNIQVQRLTLAFPGPDNTSESNPALDAVEAVLSHGRASRLERALIDTGIATGAGCDNSPGIDPSLFVCSVSLQDGKSAVVAERVILSEIQRLKTALVPAPELERAKNLVMFAMYQGLSTSSAKANSLGHMETQFNGFENGVRMLDLFMKVTPEQLMEAAKTYLKPEKRVVVIGVPK